MQYELFYLIGERNELNLDAIKKEVNDLLIAEKATLLDPELMEKRKLAYEIKHQRKGTYVTRRFNFPDVDYSTNTANTEKEFGIESITKKLNLTNTVLRFMIVKTDELPELGSKEKRQQMEQKEPRGFKKPEARGGIQNNNRGEQRQRPMPTNLKPAQEKTIEKEEMKKHSVNEPEAENKKAKDIDKQLEELLNI